MGLTGVGASCLIILTQRVALGHGVSVGQYHKDLDYRNPSATHNSMCKDKFDLYWMMSGMSYTGVLFLTLWLFTSTAVSTRWAGYNPYPYGISIIYCMVSSRNAEYFGVQKSRVYLSLCLSISFVCPMFLLL